MINLIIQELILRRILQIKLYVKICFKQGNKEYKTMQKYTIEEKKQSDTKVYTHIHTDHRLKRY